jgi:hypothetical protein
MNARETYNAIASGNSEDSRQALFQLLGMVQELSTATLELAYHVEWLNGKDALNSRSRLWLTEFLELPPRGEQAR